MKLSIGRKFFAHAITFFVFFLPLVYCPQVFNPYENPKFFLYVTFIPFISLIYFSLQLVKPEKNFQVKFDFLTLLVLIFLILVFFTDLFGFDPKISLLGSKYRHQGFLTLLSNILLFLTVRTLKVNPESKYFRIFLYLSVFFISSISLVQWALIYQFHNFSIPNYQGRIIATFGNPNFLGSYLIMLMPLVLFIDFVKILSKKMVILKYILILIITIAIVLSVSRSAILALLVLTPVYLLSLPKNQINQKSINILLISAILFILFFSSQIDLFKGRGESFWDNRLRIYTNGLIAFSKRPIFGYGQENFEVAVTKDERLIIADNAHNLFLEVLVSSGALGLIIYLTILFLAFKKASLPIKLSLTAFLITAQFNPLSISQIALFWLLLGLSDKKTVLSD